MQTLADPSFDRHLPRRARSFRGPSLSRGSLPQACQPYKWRLRLEVRKDNLAC